jgi:hypothetical protein
MMRKLLLLLAGLMSLTGCSSVDIAKYAGTTPVLDLRDYFNGTIDAHGVFQDRSGEVVKRFVVVIEASWQGDVGTLDERFTYADGTTQRACGRSPAAGPNRTSARQMTLSARRGARLAAMRCAGAT